MTKIKIITKTDILETQIKKIKSTAKRRETNKTKIKKEQLAQPTGHLDSQDCRNSASQEPAQELFHFWRV